MRTDDCTWSARGRHSFMKYIFFISKLIHVVQRSLPVRSRGCRFVNGTVPRKSIHFTIASIPAGSISERRLE
eukprot:scaffold285359_cov55-Prasinocladus_malaysianus.AAC.1